MNKLKTPPDFYRTYVIVFRKEYPVLTLLDRLAGDSHISEVHPDLLYHTFRVPNDALWQQQWDKRIVGADNVWDISTGSDSIICVGIDVGVDWNHPDLTPVLWVNPGEDLDGDRQRYTDPLTPLERNSKYLLQSDHVFRLFSDEEPRKRVQRSQASVLRSITGNVSVIVRAQRPPGRD